MAEVLRATKLYLFKELSFRISFSEKFDVKVQLFSFSQFSVNSRACYYGYGCHALLQIRLCNTRGKQPCM